MMTKEELKTYLIEEAEEDSAKVESLESYDLVRKYLEWNGIIGFTSDVINVVFAAYGIKKGL